MTDNTKYGKFICARCGHHAIDHQSLPPRTPCTIEGCKCECYVVKIKAHSLYGEFVGGRVEPSGEVKDYDFVSVYPANFLVCLKRVAGMPCVRRAKHSGDCDTGDVSELRAQLVEVITKWGVTASQNVTLAAAKVLAETERDRALRAESLLLTDKNRMTDEVAKVREYWEDARRDNSFSEKEVERQSKTIALLARKLTDAKSAYAGCDEQLMSSLKSNEEYRKTIAEQKQLIDDNLKVIERYQTERYYLTASKESPVREGIDRCAQAEAIRDLTKANYEARGRHIELLVWLAKRFSLPAHWTDEQMTAEIDKMVESYDAGMEELTKLKNGVQALIAKFSASHGKS